MWPRAIKDRAKGGVPLSPVATTPEHFIVWLKHQAFISICCPPKNGTNCFNLGGHKNVRTLSMHTHVTGNSFYPLIGSNCASSKTGKLACLKDPASTGPTWPVLNQSEMFKLSWAFMNIGYHMLLINFIWNNSNHNCTIGQWMQSSEL